MADDFTIPGEFTKEDLKIILESLDDWEVKDIELLKTIEKLKQINEPPEDANEEFREAFIAFRSHMLSQEGCARKNKEFRRERAILLKAKIILMGQGKAAEKVFEEANKEANKKVGNSVPPWLAQKDKNG